MKADPAVAESVSVFNDDSTVLVSAPAFSHTLHFLDPVLEESFQSFLHQNNHSNIALYPSSNERIWLFTLLFLSNIGITAIGYLADKISYDLVGGGLAIQCVGQSLLAVCCLVFLCANHRLKSDPRPIIRLQVSLYVLSVCVFTVLDSSLVYMVIGGDEIKPTLVGLIPLLVTFLAMQYLFSCEFFVYGITTSAALAVYLGVHLAAQDRGMTQVLLEFAVLVVASAFLIRRLYTQEKAVRLAFLLDRQEGLGKVQKAKTSHTSMQHPFASCETDDISSKLHSVHSVLTEALGVITFQDIRAKLRSALQDLEVAASRLTTQPPPEPTPPRAERVDPNIDEDDRIFVQQNYMMTKASDYATQPAPPVTQKEVVTLNINLEYGLHELVAVLTQLGKNWNFDMFFVTEVTKAKPIGIVGRYCLSKFDLTTKFNISDAVAHNFFSALEGRYKDNPYHNSTHGADVLNSTFFLYNHSFLIGHLTDVEILGAIIATLGHDVGHSAFNNRFLVNKRDTLAITCNLSSDNDMSVLEMMHASLTYSLLLEEDQNILKSLDSDSWMLCRKVVLKMILATDMARHFELLGGFKSNHAAISTASIGKIDERIAISEMCIKAADIGHAAKSIDLHERWTLLVCEEFFQQGDMEKKLGLPVSMYCDRETTDIAKVESTQSQFGFIQNIVLPLYLAINTFLGSKDVETFCIEQLRVNMNVWEVKTRKKRRYTIKSKPGERSFMKSEFQKLTERIRGEKRG